MFRLGRKIPACFGYRMRREKTGPARANARSGGGRFGRGDLWLGARGRHGAFCPNCGFGRILLTWLHSLLISLG